MSLVGTLNIPDHPARTIICVSVSLHEGLRLWARDAQQAYAIRPPSDVLVDVKKCLPGGTYSLPLTVQVPSTPRLPPSFNIPGGRFFVTYALTINLACNDPSKPGSKVVLAEASREFEMMPETMPTRAPRYNIVSFCVRGDGTPEGGVLSAKGLVRRPNSRWTVEPSLPTTTYSPTSVIPLKIKMLAPTVENGPAYQILVRLTLVRREHSSLSMVEIGDATGRAGLVSEEIVNARFAWFESNSTAPLNVETTLPLMTGDNWDFGFSTMLNVGPHHANPTITDNISVSSTFHLAATIAFLPLTPGGPTFENFLKRKLPPAGTWKQATDCLKFASFGRNFPGTIRTIPMPIVVGSVSEPRHAMHSIRWSDLHLDNSSGREIGRMINGEEISCENGWIMPPPDYDEAIQSAPYH